MSNPRIIGPQPEEPITLAMARLQCRIDAIGSPPESDLDPLLTIAIATAREWAEGYATLSFTTRVLEYTVDAFPSLNTKYPPRALRLPYGPVQSVLGVWYTDAAETEQALSGFRLGADGLLWPALSAAWPSTTDASNAVRIRYLAGYTLAGDSPSYEPLPQRATQAMLLCIGHWMANAENTTDLRLIEIPFGAKDLLNKLKSTDAMA